MPTSRSLTLEAWAGNLNGRDVWKLDDPVGRRRAPGSTAVAAAFDSTGETAIDADNRHVLRYAPSGFGDRRQSSECTPVAVRRDDRGRIEEGRRADPVRVRHEEGVPVVRSVWRAGERVI